MVLALFNVVLLAGDVDCLFRLDDRCMCVDLSSLPSETPQEVSDPQIAALKALHDKAQPVISGRRHINGEGSSHQKKKSPLQPPSTIHTGIVLFWSRFRRRICIIKYTSSIHEGNFIASSAQRSCASSLNSLQRHLYCANKIDNDLRLSVIE